MYVCECVGMKIIRRAHSSAPLHNHLFGAGFLVPAAFLDAGNVITVRLGILLDQEWGAALGTLLCDRPVPGCELAVGVPRA